MLTITGAAFCIVAFYGFFMAPQRLFPIVIVASIFQASSAFNWGGHGIQPYYIVACIFIARTILDESRRGSEPRPAGFKGERVLMAFCLVGVASAFLLPRLFSGIPVYDPGIGIDMGLMVRPPLDFSIENLSQAAFLAIQTGVVWAASRSVTTFERARGTYVCTFYIVAGICVAQFICLHLAIKFPDSIFHTNPAYYMSNLSGDYRSSGTFAEPSFAGAPLVMFYIGFLAELLAGKGQVLRVVMAIAAIVTVASSGSILAAALMTLVLLIFHPTLPGKHSITRRLKWASLLAIVGVAILASPLKTTLLENTFDKRDTSSFEHRAIADLYAVELTFETNGLGVGLGSNRPSSLIPALLSNMGLLGFGLFFLMIVRVLKNAAGPISWLRWACAGLLLDMLIDIPDITFAALWIVLGMSALYAHRSLCAESPGSNAALSTAEPA